MRTWYLPSAVLRLALIGGVASLAGCDDITAGVPEEASGPPKVSRVVVQDDGTVNYATDLLNKAAPTPCAEDKPCTSGGFGYPAPQCTNDVCPDPMSSICAVPNTGEYFGNPVGPLYDACDTGDVDRPTPVTGVDFIRVVFNKRLCNTVETVTVDPMTGNAMYKLANDVIQLIGPNGPVAVDTMGGPRTPPGAYYDPTGSAEATSDPVFEPFGPALVFVPGEALHADTEYTIKLDLANIKDCSGASAQGEAGGYKFKTEKIQVRAAAPDVSVADTVIAPDDVLTFNFNVPIGNATSWDGMAVVPGTATFAFTCGAQMLTGEGWLDVGTDPDAGTDPTMCGSNPGQLNVVAVSAPGVQVDLPEGMCTLAVKGLKELGATATRDFNFTFAVKGPNDPMNDPNSFHATDAMTMMKAVWILPEQCM